jgi:hypothetical protein
MALSGLRAATIEGSDVMHRSITESPRGNVGTPGHRTELRTESELQTQKESTEPPKASVCLGSQLGWCAFASPTRTMGRPSVRALEKDDNSVVQDGLVIEWTVR